ncbi:MAG: adenosine deaminase [Clostridia bacterium]|nr:adenosine deaminase [Clostridia bacterium]
MIDLHLHLDGSLTPDDIIELAEIQKVELPTYDKAELRKYLSFSGERTLKNYLTYFDLPLSVMQSKQSISRAVEMLVTRLAKKGMVYAEIRFAPLLHTRNGLTVDEVVESAIEGLKKGLDKGKFIAQLILCCMRNVGTSVQNEKTVLAVSKYLGKGVCALDLAGDEEGFTYEKYASLFEKAKALSLPITIHAGERGGADCVLSAIRLGAKRIGHGVRLIQDQKLTEYVKSERIGIEMCPISNYQTGAIENMQDYPLREYLAKGILATVNTDSTVVSSTSIEKEFEFLRENCGFTLEEKVKAVMNAVNIAFLPDCYKDIVRNRILMNLAKQSESKY